MITWRSTHHVHALNADTKGFTILMTGVICTLFLRPFADTDGLEVGDVEGLEEESKVGRKLRWAFGRLLEAKTPSEKIGIGRIPCDCRMSLRKS